MNKYTIIKANLKNNKEDILAILNRNFSNMSEQIYHWKYEKCPYGNACWLAKEVSSDSFVGFGALFPRKFLINGKLVYTAIAGDFGINREHRVYGPALKLQQSIQTSVKGNTFKFIYGFPNNLAKALLLRIGYEEIGRFKRFVKILKTEYRFKKYLPPSFITKIFSKVIDFIIKVLSTEVRFKRSLKVSIEMPEFFDKRFDVFWKKVLKQFNIIGERNSKFLNWRYIQSPAYDYKIFCVINERKDITGYVIYYVESNMCHIVDMLSINSERILDLLLMKFINYSRQKDIGSISLCFFGNKLIEKKLKKFNFFLRKNEDTKIIMYGNYILKDTFLFNKEKWYLFLGDSDV